MNSKILMSVMVVGVALMMGAVGGLAYFTDVETSSGNEIRAGTLDIYITDEDEGWRDGNPVSASISSSDLAPGESFTSDVIAFKNVGNIDAKYLFARFCELKQEDGNTSEPGPSASANDIAKKIKLVSVSDYSGDEDGWDTTPFNTTTSNVWLDFWGATQDGVISLYDLVYAANPGGPSSKTGLYFYDLDSNNNVDTWLPAGTVGKVKFTFKLMVDANNNYQGDKVSFRVDFIASQYKENIDANITETLGNLSG